MARSCLKSSLVAFFATGSDFVAGLIPGCKKRIQATLIVCIHIYRYAFSLLFGHCCRFQPSCSTYAIEAINVHGNLKGCYYALRRVLRCHPWHAGGVDPVPSNHLNQRKRS